jgi:predicted TPR repeat methyltransferase
MRKCVASASFLAESLPIVIAMTTLTHPTHQELTTLFSKASDAHQRGALSEAAQTYMELLQFCPDLPLLHYNLGLVHLQAGEYTKAHLSFVAAVQLAPEDMDCLFNLALTQKKIGDVAAAITSYKRVLELEPEIVDALYNLGGCYKDSGRFGEAMDMYRQVLRHQPDHPAANGNLAFLCHRQGDSEAALLHYRRLLEVHPHHPAARHMVAALTGEAATESPELYVREVFEQYSDHYEQSLVTELEYCVPAKLRLLVEQHAPGRRFQHGLDLGCGTGLGGEAFADAVEVLDGVDLSPRMLELAAAKNLYGHLYVSSIDGFVQATADSRDFALAADVLAYVGELGATFTLLAAKMRPEALFAFSTERWSGEGYRLQGTGRFAHHPGYVRAVAESCGWRVLEQRQEGLRKEKGQWVSGDLWLCCRDAHQKGGGD